MKIKKIEWVEMEGTWRGFIDKIYFFSIFYDAITPREKRSGKDYIIAHCLPGFKKKRLYVESIEQGKIIAKELITRYIARMIKQDI